MYTLKAAQLTDGYQRTTTSSINRCECTQLMFALEHHDCMWCGLSCWTLLLSLAWQQAQASSRIIIAVEQRPATEEGIYFNDPNDARCRGF